MRRFLSAIFPLVICWFVVGCGGGGNDAASASLNATNAAPIASAGSVQNVVVGTAVTLDGSASSDANGDPLTYAWTLTAKPPASTASLSDAASARPTFTPDAPGNYVAKLVVNDGKAESSAAIVTMTATVVRSVIVGGGVLLEATGWGIMPYRSWTMISKPSGSAATLVGDTGYAAQFIPDVVGTYMVTLVSSDDTLSSEPLSFVINAEAAVAFNSIPSPLSASVPSYGFEANSINSLGDRITLPPSEICGGLVSQGTWSCRPGPNIMRLYSIAVAMSSWACETGSSGAENNCASTANSAFDHPITINIYNDSGALLATRTQTFAIPYRPSADPACPEGRWKASDGGCHNALAFMISFDLHALKVTLPDTFVYEVVYNTSTHGTSPIGQAGGYDSLGVGVYSTHTATPSVGSDPDVGYVRWNGSLVDQGVGIMAEVRTMAPDPCPQDGEQRIGCP